MQVDLEPSMGAMAHALGEATELAPPALGGTEAVPLIGSAVMRKN